METDPRTIIITVDDDLDYPSTLIEHLYQAAVQRPDAAIGLKGYWLPPTNTSAKEKCDPRTWDHVLQERAYGYYSHENLLYTDAASTDRDVEVHVLGGLLGVAYRSGFFDLRRLVDFGAWPGGSVFVDDDWLSSVRSRRPVVLWCLHFVDVTRVHLTMTWVVSVSISRPFGHRDPPRRCSIQHACRASCWV